MIGSPFVLRSGALREGRGLQGKRKEEMLTMRPGMCVGAVEEDFQRAARRDDPQNAEGPDGFQQRLSSHFYRDD